MKIISKKYNSPQENFNLKWKFSQLYYTLSIEIN